MGSVERSKKKAQYWKRAIFRFSVCLLIGFFTGFAQTIKAFTFAGRVAVTSDKADFSPHTEPISRTSVVVNASLKAETAAVAALAGGEDQLQEEEEEEVELIPRRLLIIVTPTGTKDKFRGVFLRRLSNTLRLVPAPLLWIILEGQSQSNEVSEILRNTGIMYRHLVSKGNFTDPEAETDHQFNVALHHIEHHRISGILHFSMISNTYDLDFFEELREIEALGKWPVCKTTSQAGGWHDGDKSNGTDPRPPLMMIHPSSFAFNSSILWDPEKWGRPSSSAHPTTTTTNAAQFVKQIVLEDDAALKGVQGKDCSKNLVWHQEIQVNIGKSKIEQL
ncbi:beta-1,4-xylosyltransferase IRX9-like isoform X2 [Syzygium oleosum]|uniref:beta-1,4-xylosyltransferase IRX9-like isoform X2 n=1 Tax=Syzygium oleosum TaxID=219896 RepID=UPI0024BBE53B|nr:beta-1,4-xylosyltransferase IRX9-like isoform X2 [Syzygium oleosum]